MRLEPSVKNYSVLSENEKESLLANKFESIFKYYSKDLNTLFQIWLDCKKAGQIEKAEKLLQQMIKCATDEKRVWMLKKLNENLGRRNQSQKKEIEQSIRDMTQMISPKKIVHENFSILKIVERDLIHKELFESWIESLDRKMNIEVYRLLYLGILYHGVSDKIALALTNMLANSRNAQVIQRIRSDFNLSVGKTKVEPFDKDESAEIKFDFSRMAQKSNDESTGINIALIDENIVRRYLNDILFSLLCLKDYKSIYRLNEILECSFHKRTKEYLTYNFYKLSALLEEEKYRQVMSLIKGEILNYPLTSKEAMPFIYLLAESYLGLDKFEKALDLFLILQEDKMFHGKAKIRINEIKKN